MEERSARHQPFCLAEGPIDELHAATQSGQTTRVEVVQRYIERVRAYNGVASALVTQEGASIPEATGTVRGKSALRFLTQTIKASTMLPDLDRHPGAAARMRAHGGNRLGPLMFNSSSG